VRLFVLKDLLILLCKESDIDILADLIKELLDFEDLETWVRLQDFSLIKELQGIILFEWNLELLVLI